MNCPHCNTENDPSNQFCEKCGKPIHEVSTPSVGVEKNAARDHLLAHTLKLIVALFGLWLIKVILVDLSFVKELRIPQLPVPVTTLVQLIVLLFVFFLLLGYARTVSALWPYSFPRLSEANNLWTAIIALILLGIVYKIIKPILLEFSNDAEPLMIIQIVLVLIAVVIVFRAGIIVYQAIPLWYLRIKEDWSNITKNISK